ncbi:hypothetical protein E3N88_29051 [Mikania micrantha]|uniref:Uncharacterized protein n=1 Tax=Mikania micrantha TaxID=192012 RepID=A0A5N6N2G8_9ASTR|nr:hypothetical protein E3N88_29051 [Mikania micrantha]
MLPPAISIQDMANVVWSIMHCSDLQSGWPYGSQQWGLSGPNSTIQNYHAERNTLLTVRAPRVAGNKLLVASSGGVLMVMSSKLPSMLQWLPRSFKASSMEFYGEMMKKQRTLRHKQGQAGTRMLSLMHAFQFKCFSFDQLRHGMLLELYFTFSNRYGLLLVLKRFRKR